jgi:2',3'-cyclic-nucleotide 2'-phosphodiesterase (5'-nucleotidase family)
MNRRHFLAVAGSGLSLPGWAGAKDGGSFRTVSVIHTTDLHGHILPTRTYEGVGNVGGLARCAAVIRRWRAESPHHLLVDVGDLYQGTEVGLRTRGKVMVRLINALGYDAWVLGNHDFDWGRDVLESAVADATLPVLAGNVRFSGKAPGTHPADSPFARVVPHVLKEVGGFKIGLIGTVTPGLGSWLAPEVLREIEAGDPVEPLRASIAALRAAGARAIIVAGHMGFKSARFIGDDFANRVSDLTRSCPGIDAFLGGHTHRDVPAAEANGVPYSQANYYGIHLGRLDLTFHVESGRLIDCRPFTLLMDDRFEPDPAVISLAKSDLDLSNAELARPVGRVTDRLSAKATPTSPSEQEKLIGLAIKEALASRSVQVDGVLHGAFSDDDIEPGPKTIGDIWQVMPFENYLVTAGLSPAELTAVLDESLASGRGGRNGRSLLGFRVQVDTASSPPKVTGLFDRDGRPLDPARRYRIAFNSYDAQSGGQRMPLLKRLVASATSASSFHPIETRQAVIDLFSRHGEVSPALLAPM